MLTMQMGNRPDLSESWWGADNGCFTRPHQFDLSRYLAWLDRMSPDAPRCLFATAPDVLGDPAATWARSESVLPLIAARGYRAALVAQDGLEPTHLDGRWDAFGCLFIGGSPAWKLSERTYGLAREAKARGKWVHMGGVNSWRRLRALATSGCYDSADGTKVAFAPDSNVLIVAKWLTLLRQQQCLDLWEAAS